MNLWTKERFEKETGIPTTTLDGWIRRYLTEGVHYFAPTKKTTLIDPEAVDQWIRNTRASERTKAVSRFDGKYEDGDIPSSSPGPQTRRTLELPPKYAGRG